MVEVCRQEGKKGEQVVQVGVGEKAQAKGVGVREAGSSSGGGR